MLNINYVAEQGRRFFPITSRKAIVGLATNTLVLSESVDIDIDINADGEPITINPVVKTELDKLLGLYNALNTSTTASINAINETLRTKANSDTNGVAHASHRLQTARRITIAGAVTGNVTFDGTKDVSINVGVNHTHNYAGSSSAGGSANNALRLTTSRTITLTGVVRGSVGFNGSGDVSINTTFGNSANYLPLSGGIVTGSFTANGNIQAHGRYHQGGIVGSLVAVQSGGPSGNMLWAW